MDLIKREDFLQFCYAINKIYYNRYTGVSVFYDKNSLFRYIEFWSCN